MVKLVSSQYCTIYILFIHIFHALYCIKPNHQNATMPIVATAIAHATASSDTTDTPNADVLELKGHNKKKRYIQQRMGERYQLHRRRSQRMKTTFMILLVLHSP